MNYLKFNSLHTKNTAFLCLIVIMIAAVSCNEPKNSKSTEKSGSNSQLLPLSPMVEVNGTLYISGQIAPAENGENKSIEAETKEVMQKIGAILMESGYDFKNVVRCSVFLTDINDYAAVNQAYASFFSGEYPSRNAVEVSRLVKNARIEISAIAVKRETQSSKTSN